MMNEKCAACIHCEVCGFIESEVAKDGSCAFYEDGKEWELTKEEKALLQKWHDNRGISMKDFEDAMDALEQEPCREADDYENEIEDLHNRLDIAEYDKERLREEVTNLEEKIKALEHASVLDKIRAEIETKYGQCDICEYFENYDYEENDISEYRPIGNIMDILQIIDRYRAESEGTNESI